MEDRRELLRQIQMMDFAMHEAALFLDVNPTNQQALNYFQQAKKAREALAATYMEKYGPLTHYDSSDTQRWRWIDPPWPWHNEEVV